jgi:hypothetical protein
MNLFASPAARRLVGLSGVCAIGVLLTSAHPAGAPQDKPAPAAWKVPRTADGHPDLQGTYSNNSITPLERPKEFADKPLLSDAEFAEMQQAVKDVLDGSDAPFGDELFHAAAARNKGHKSADRQVGNYSQVWLSDRVLEKRTSQIVDPPDGRIPALTPQAVQRNAERAAARKANPPSQLEALGNSTRCISMGMPNLFAGYQSYYDFVQGPGYVVIRTEMIHEARVVPTDGRPHLASSLRQLHGHSVGRWEGDTLVVETTNFSPRSNFRGSSENLQLAERFTRVSADLIEYRITATDPTTWVRPWTILINLRRTEEKMFEYACHEGNYGLFGILSAQKAER